METTKTWNEMSTEEQFKAAAAHAHGFRNNGIEVSDEHFLRMLNLAHPTVIWTNDSQVRIAPESVDICNTIINKYLLEESK